MVAEDSKKHLARFLRRRLEGCVPGHILHRLSDDELIEDYNEHHASKLEAVRQRKATTEGGGR